MVFRFMLWNVSSNTSLVEFSKIKGGLITITIPVITRTAHEHLYKRNILTHRPIYIQCEYLWVRPLDECFTVRLLMLALFVIIDTVMLIDIVLNVFVAHIYEFVFNFFRTGETSGYGCSSQ